MQLVCMIAAIIVATNAHVIQKRDAGGQTQKVWDALKELRGGKDITVVETQDLLKNAIAGVDYPINAIITEKVVNCGQYKQAGFYADDSEPSKCQIFHRCDDNGKVNSFLCPNATLFNQITLVCDWFFNVDCSISKKFIDYSNSRLEETGVPLLDNQLIIQLSTGAVDVTQKVDTKLKLKKQGRTLDTDAERPSSNELPSLPNTVFVESSTPQVPAVVPTQPATASPVEVTTQAPTVLPTQPATASPVEATTQAPTVLPTQPATASPVEVTTQVPTVLPTQPATASPVEVTTQAPTVLPTQPATASPVEVTTQVPTVLPTQPATASPVEATTQAPTVLPTQPATASPVEATTQAPTVLPTQPATASPVEVTTQVPIVLPTQPATASPVEVTTQASTQVPTQPISEKTK